MKPLNQISVIIHTTDDDAEKLKEKLLAVKGIDKVWVDRWVYKS